MSEASAVSSLRSGQSPSGLHYLATGPSGNVPTTLICIPGWACRASDFSSLFRVLAENNPDESISAYAVDLPGHGSTLTFLSPDATIASYASLIQTFIQELSFSGLVLVGHSMGTRVVLQTWLQSSQMQREAIRGIIFLDGSHYKLRGVNLPFDARDPRSEGLSAEVKREMMTDFFGRMLGPNTPKGFAEEALRHVRGMKAEHIVRERDGLLTFDFESLDDGLEGLRREAGECEVLNLQSTAINEEGQRVFLKSGEVSGWMRHLREKVPRAKLDVIEDASHFPHVDQPEATSAKIVQFAKTLNSHGL